MQIPNKKTVLRDDEKKITYEVLAYRLLGEQEMVSTVRFYLASLKKNKRPKSGQTVTITTSIGADSN